MRSFGLIMLVLIAGCGKKPSADKVTYVAENDPKMNAAIDKARASVNTFTQALKAPKPTQSAFSVKMPFTDGKHTEHMWLTSVTFDGQKFHGTLNNDPEMVSNVKIGAKVSVESSKISDWMFVENGKLVGGYTLRVLRASMSASERADFDKSVPFTID
jgi:uncharacterized protein YegJ (DUF2314 family)